MLSLKGQKVLAISAHIDDVELGAGATLHRLARENEVHYVGLSLPPLVEREVFMEEFKQSTACLGLTHDRITLRDFDPRNLFDSRTEILQLFYDVNAKLKPDVVLIPNTGDTHQSHEVVCAEARRRSSTARSWVMSFRGTTSSSRWMCS